MKTLAPITMTQQPLQGQASDAAVLRQGLSDHSFIAFYEPQVSLKNNKIIGLEVLARWQHPHKGLLTPGHFLEAIQRHGLLDELFLRLFEQGLVLRQKLACLGLALNMSFNLLPIQLSNPMLIEAIMIILRAHDCQPHAITFEVTDTGTFELCSASLISLLKLRQMGCGLSMDDFGTGRSSLERLCDLPFSELKLDSCFVHKLDTHPSSTAIISHTVSLADALGLSLVIEGVETSAQLKRLKAMGCSIIQGYVIAQPMPDTAVLPYILEQVARPPVNLNSV